MARSPTEGSGSPRPIRRTSPPTSTGPRRPVRSRARACGCSRARTRHNAHKTETWVVRYTWHPLYEQPVEVRVGERYHGVVRCFVPGEERRAKLLPEWMLDEAVCARMHLAKGPCASIAALEALLDLLAETGTVDAGSHLADVAAHGATIEEEGSAARADGTGPADPVVGDAAGRMPPRGGRAAHAPAAKRGGRRQRGGGR